VAPTSAAPAMLILVHAGCTANDGSATGDSTQCTSGFCRYNACSNPPSTPLGGPCNSDMDCEGEGYAEQAVACGPDNRCGGKDAFCYSNDGAGDGASSLCRTSKHSTGMMGSSLECAKCDRTQTSASHMRVALPPPVRFLGREGSRRR
jgi:hypothetical protein